MCPYEASNYRNIDMLYICVLCTLEHQHRSVHHKKRGHREQLPYRQDSNEFHSKYSRSNRHGIPALEHASPIPMNLCRCRNAHSVWMKIACGR